MEKGNGSPKQTVNIKLLRDNEEAFVPITTPDAVICDVNESGDSITLSHKLYDLFGEDQSIGTRLNNIDKDLGNIHNQIDGANNSNSIQNQINNNDKDIANINTNINRIDKSISTINNNINTINNTLQTKADKITVENEIRRIDEELDTKGIVISVEGQYGDQPIPDNYYEVYNTHYIDNYMISKKQAETYIAQTIDSQTYSKAELDSIMGESIHCLDYQNNDNITLVSNFKCQFIEISGNATVKCPDIPTDDYNGNIVKGSNYRYIKILLYVRAQNPCNMTINNSKGQQIKRVDITAGINEIEITYIIGNWCVQKIQNIG